MSVPGMPEAFVLRHHCSVWVMGEKSPVSFSVSRIERMLVQEQGDLGLRCDDFPPFDLSVKEWLFSLLDCGYILPGPPGAASSSLPVGHTAPAQLRQVHGLSPQLPGLRQPCAQASQPGLQLA